MPWLGHTCGHCTYCKTDRENLCDAPGFTGCTRDGGFASHLVAEAAFIIPLDPSLDPVATAPLLCAGLIGWRTLQMAGDALSIGLYGCGAAAHIVAQVGGWGGRRVFAPDGSLVPAALRAVRNDGWVVCGGIHMSDIPAFPYDLLWGERSVRSVANLTREDARTFFETAPQAGIVTRTRTYRLAQANEAIGAHRSGILHGAAVLVP